MSPAECVHAIVHMSVLHTSIVSLVFGSVSFSSIYLNHLAAYRSYAPNRWLTYSVFLLSEGCVPYALWLTGLKAPTN